MGHRWYQKAGVQSAIIAGVSAILGTLLGGWIAGESRENQRLREQLAKWRFSEPLYRRLPNDVDFLVRGLRVDKKQGGAIVVAGPREGDRFSVVVSQLQPRSTEREGLQRYTIEFAVQGNLGTNHIRPNSSGPMLVESGAISRPINAGSYEFLIVVDKVDIDFVHLSVARRPTGVIVEYSNIPSGVLDFRGPVPPPIIQDAPE